MMLTGLQCLVVVVGAPVIVSAMIALSDIPPRASTLSVGQSSPLVLIGQIYTLQHVFERRSCNGIQTI